MENNFGVEKKLTAKKDKFDFFDSGFASVSFIVLLLVTKIFIGFFWTENIQRNFAAISVFLYLLLYILVSVLVESVFYFAGTITAKNRKVDYVKATTFNKMPSGKSMLLGIVIALVSIFAFSGLTNVFITSLQKFGYKSSMGGMTIPNLWIYLIYVVVIAVVPAIFEESLFRGVILQGFRKNGIHFAVLMSALIFMLMHGGPDQTIHQFILGVILGYVFVYSGSIWVPILIHFLNNFISVTMIFITSLTSTSSSSGDTASQLPSWGELALTLAYSLALSALGAYIIFICVKQMKKEKDDKHEKDQQVMLELVSKEELTDQEVALLRKLIADNKEYEENFLTNKKNSTDQDKQDESIVDEYLKEMNNKKDSKFKIAGIIMLIASLTYLAANWLIKLIGGFMG